MNPRNHAAHCLYSSTYLTSMPAVCQVSPHAAAAVAVADADADADAMPGGAPERAHGTAMQKAVDIPEVRSVASPYPLDCRSGHSTGTIFPRPHLLVADSSYISLSLVTDELRRTLGGLSLGGPTYSAGKVVSTNRSRHSCLELDSLKSRVAPKNMRARDT